METGNIVLFLQTAYSDERLVELKTHVEEGCMSFYSCCCLVGAATSDHSLVGFGYGVYCKPNDAQHLVEAKELIYGADAEQEFHRLGSDEDRMKVLLPLINAEIDRRAKSRLGIAGTPIEVQAI